MIGMEQSTDIAALERLPDSASELGVICGPLSCAMLGTHCGECTNRLCHPDRDTC
jgi:hypothetical protein